VEEHWGGWQNLLQYRRKKDDCAFFIPIGDLLHKNADLRDTIFAHLIFIKTQYEDDREKKEEWFSRLKELSLEDEKETSAEDQIFDKIMGVVNGVHDSIASKGNMEEMSEKDIVKNAIDNLDVDSILGVTDSVKNGDVNPFRLISKLMGSAKDLIPTKWFSLLYQGKRKELWPTIQNRKESSFLKVNREENLVSSHLVEGRQEGNLSLSSFLKVSREQNLVSSHLVEGRQEGNLSLSPV
jgi:hypothetical protein